MSVQHSACIGKIKHATATAAQRHAHRAQQRKRPAARKQETEGKLRPYRCPFCGYWHVGTEMVNQK